MDKDLVVMTAASIPDGMRAVFEDDARGVLGLPSRTTVQELERSTGTDAYQRQQAARASIQENLQRITALSAVLATHAILNATSYVEKVIGLTDDEDGGTVFTDGARAVALTTRVLQAESPTLTYPWEPSVAVQKLARELDVVIAFGHSDDVVELRGAIHDEINAGSAYRLEPGRAEAMTDEDVAEESMILLSGIHASDSDAEEDQTGWRFNVTAGHTAALPMTEDGEPYGEVMLIYIGD